MPRNNDPDAQFRNMKRLSMSMIGVSLAFLAGFAWYSRAAEQKYMTGKLASLLRHSVQFCEMYFQRVERQHRILGAELLQDRRQVSADKAINMLNNYKGINQDQRWFALLSGNGELIAETDVALDERRPYFLSEIPSRNLPPDLPENEKLEFERPEDGIFDVGLVMPFRYAIRDGRGELKYIVRSRLRVGPLRDMWRTSLVPQESTLGVVHDDGYLITRYAANPGIESEGQFGHADAAVLDKHLKSGGFPNEGFVVITRAAPASDLLVVYQRMIRYPVIAFVSVPASFITMEWWERTQAPFILAIVVLLGELAIYGLMIAKYRAERIFSRRQAELKDIARGILVTQERERSRLSHELHDEIGQSLTALKITLNRARQSLDDHGKADTLLGGGQRMLEEMVDSVRQIAYRLRPSELDQLGLAAALRAHVDRVIRPVFQEVRLSENIGQGRFHRDLELCCFRVAQEALTNILRHAQATRIDISLTRDLSRLTLAVKDNGIGFDVEGYDSARIFGGETGNRGLGLVGMRERVMSNGGRLHIRALPEGGVEIKAVFEKVEEV
jgi:signal transduction histidine kinase